MAVKWHLIDEEDADLAARLLLDFSNRRVNLIAPDFIHYEVSSALLAASFGKRPRLTHGECLKAVGDFITADHTLYRRTRHLPLVKWIGDYSLPESSAKPGGSNAP